MSDESTERGGMSTGDSSVASAGEQSASSSSSAAKGNSDGWDDGQRSFAIGSVDRRKSLLFVLLNVKDFTTHFDCLLLVLLLVSFV